MTAGMIMGTGIFGALGATAEHAGSALLLAMIPGGLVCWATGISGAQLGVNFPRHGGAFLWARAFHYNRLAFVAGCCYVGQGIDLETATRVVYAQGPRYNEQDIRQAQYLNQPDAFSLLK